ncbi:MAG: ribonuclease P protein component [Candidatus Nealsonbacteria bacterium RBG_13_38_11]|uniref:Ribonuclease P protein component n=1 Tax=Candidatus Nealsonbacteria bacterium RBG_13_38_11 TaxID=1801662 RepID=A0A1G2DZQ1_9BACT|nr:MAG: ribonuclease P protein component [Candidatus Nealsonbacteria bacterium RBG_13_38_11]
MLPLKNRIRKKKDIEKIFKRGRTFKEASLILKTLKNNLGLSRFGFVVSQKISKKANVRNKIKRRLREIVRFNPLKTDTDNLFIALPGIEKKDFTEIKKTVEKLLSKIK